MRLKYGCDTPCKSARYDITCPRCNGSLTETGEDGERRPCRACEHKGNPRGKKLMRRCFAHFQSRDVASALRAWRWLERGHFPVEGGLGAQHPAFLRFVEAVEAEVGVVRSEQREERSRK